MLTWKSRKKDNLFLLVFQTDRAGHGGDGEGDGLVPVGLPGELVHDAVVQGEVDTEPDGQGDHHRLQDVQLPTQQDEHGHSHH